MRAITAGTAVFWVLCLGAIAMFAFFAALGAFDPGEVMWLTITMGVLALLSFVHFVRVRRALDGGANLELARTVHAMRERRGF